MNPTLFLFRNDKLYIFQGVYIGHNDLIKHSTFTNTDRLTVAKPSKKAPAFSSLTSKLAVFHRSVFPALSQESYASQVRKERTDLPSRGQ
ncbi:hypothetical protein TSAR_010975 [Trichomalopsis sarcophagae]|uniref:Uncharacterized protein n=1 Tax=Trichomalopsis sarcophagae TaxID=543379 RepID=A0A232EVP0_9HYME|nr:hypothetical protein TSAR_010975 [Trichomalopsis sarcophagae]